MTKRLVLIGIISALAVTAFFWVSRKKADSPASSAGPDVTRKASTEMQKSAVAADRSDYAAILWPVCGGYASLGGKDLNADALLCDAEYCEAYVAWHTALAYLEWGDFLKKSGLGVGDKGHFVENVARKKLALAQAKIAARALRISDAGKNGRADFIASVVAEQDSRIGSMLDEKSLALYQATRENSVAAMLEPYFFAAAASGVSLSNEQTHTLADKASASLPKLGQRGTPSLEALLAYDGASDENLSLDQVLVLRTFQEHLRKVKASDSSGDDSMVIGVAGFLNVANKNLGLEPKVVDELGTLVAGLLCGRMDSGAFAKSATTLVGAENFKSLVNLARRKAVDMEAEALERKLYMAAIITSDAERAQLRRVLDEQWSGESQTNTAFAERCKKLPEAIKLVALSHWNGIQAARKISTALRMRVLTR